ncbi:uncharacterized protein IL334_005192 [Kwoniella shivajii]|uniref:Uncharacterized protein n=1 Tax=Kwoniella shivajii TaxID=564305 RepID=A0ABZ1D2G8_9TREE|nr:hypothetical protein IL334_005192 [Kwoniella shivajii]
MQDDDTRWIPIPPVRPRDLPQDKIRLTDLLSPRPSLDRMRSTSSLTHNTIQSNRTEHVVDMEGRDKSTSIRRTGSKIWTKAKEVTRKASIRRPIKKRNEGGEGTGNMNGSGSGTSEEEWEVVTPPLGFCESSTGGSTSGSRPRPRSRSGTSASVSGSSAIDEDGLGDQGARRTGTISRVHPRTQIALDIPQSHSRESGSENDETSHPSSLDCGSSGSGSREQRSSEAHISNYHFPIPPTHSRPQRSWLEGGSITLPEDRELERTLPSDHPFNSPRSIQTHSHSHSHSYSHSQAHSQTPSHSPSQPQLQTRSQSLSQSQSHPHSQQSHSDTHYHFNSPSQTQSRIPPASSRSEHTSSIPPIKLPVSHGDEPESTRYNHLRELFSSLQILRQTLYSHNAVSIKILSSSSDILPASIVIGIEKRLDRYWGKWTNVLNSAGHKVSQSLVDIHPCQSSLNRDIRPGSRNDIGTLIQPPLTNDMMERLIWALEDKGQVASGTYRRMYGSNVKARKLTEVEEEQADNMGIRDWMIGKEEREEREEWRNRMR